MFSILTASLGIFIRRWLKISSHNPQLDAEDWIRVRHDRYASLLCWKVFEVASLLPLLLQFATLLFLIGLALLVLPISSTTGWLLTGVGILYNAILGLCLLVPMVSTSGTHRTRTPLLR